MKFWRRSERISLDNHLLFHCLGMKKQNSNIVGFQKVGTAVGLTLLMGCGGGESLDREAWLDKGAETLTPLKQGLMGALTEALQDGPVAAIEVCSVKAPGIAESLSGDGVAVGRTSHKLRNPENAPRAWVQPLLEAYVANPENPAPEVVSLEDGAVGYVEPIFVNAMCLTCHGETLAPTVASALDARYPNDEARGFGVGDFRGLFWIEFD